MRHLVFCLLFPLCFFAQNDALLTQVVADKENFAITTALGGSIPSPLFVLNQTEAWRPLRFKLSDKPVSDSALKKMKQNEYHPYNHTFLFKDSMLNALFNEKEKDHFHATCLQLKPRAISLANTKPVTSLATAPNGFFFGICDPIISLDGKYAFVDIAVYEKTKNTKKLSEAYFATVCILYRNSPVGWEKLKVIQYLFL